MAHVQARGRLMVMLALVAVGVTMLSLAAGIGRVRAQDAVAIDIADFAFNPASVEITEGTTVTWTNQDSAPHTATGDNGEFDTGQLAQGDSASVTFDTAGTYAYHCSIHPNMVASIVVTAGEPADAPEPAPTPATPSALPNTGSGTTFGGSDNSLLLAGLGAVAFFLAAGAAWWLRDVRR